MGFFDLAQGDDGAYNRKGGKVTTARETLIMELNELESRLLVGERGGWVLYFVKLFNDRAEAIARKTTFDRPGGTALSEIVKTVTLQNYQTELSDWSPAALWSVKGLWGVPLEFGEQKCLEVSSIR